MAVVDLVDEVIGVEFPDDPAGVVAVVKDLITLRNAVEARLAAGATIIDRLGVAKRMGSTTSKVVQANGAAPAAAARWLRIGTGLVGLDRTAGYFRDGFLSAEHVEAVIRGISHIGGRMVGVMSGDYRSEVERKLLAHAISGAPPAEIGRIARAMGNEVAGESGGVPAAEDASMNSLDYVITSDGRLSGRFDVDAVTGEKMMSALDVWSRPRPQPDGSADARPPTQRRADALHQLLDCGGGGGQGLVSAPRTEVAVTVPADHPDRAVLRWMGPVTEATAAAAACDAVITSITLDGQQVPIDLSSPKRLFTGPVRKAILLRDTCCIKCGAPATWSDCHHIVHWADGGPTTLANGCLLCRTYHRAVHHTDWDIVMGADGHPWLIPPADIDPTRQPLPAYNRRTLTHAA
ncbi:HNH endonuclease signature motif containing protein [Williamsia muralis]|uniref:HNH endonuclease signature motif containing protein n=1 Tax=Williamsia marianensis TaxID=85044 RepID=A0ABU4EV14_WILMA|nr:HNH endonuclease signature motif containing protein [Williamsia muralis]MDV7135108.1 HNH endonuclease signature motif containing protein [Williamsia muralis]